MNGQDFYDLAKRNHACTWGLYFLHRAAVNRGKTLKQVEASVLFDAMLLSTARKPNEMDNTICGGGYLRWTFVNLLDWTHRHPYGPHPTIRAILRDAGCTCGKAAINDTISWGAYSIWNHLSVSDCCKSRYTRKFRNPDHTRQFYALSVIHAALCRAFS